MAETKTSAAKVEYRHDDVRGQHQIGVSAGGVFVAFASLDDAVYDQRAENYANAEPAGGEGSEGAS